MPIDASIYALQKPLPPPINPMEVASQAMTLRNQQQAGRIADERLKQEQLQNAEAEREAQDLQTVRGLQAELGGDTDAVLKAAYGKISPTLHTKLTQGAIATKKSLAEMAEKDRETLKFKAAHLGTVAQRMVGLPPEAKQGAWMQERARAVQYGIELPEAYPGDDAMNAERMDALGLEKWLAEGRAAEESKQKATAAGNADAAEKQTLAEKYLQQDAAALALAAEQQGPEGLAAAIAQLPPDRRKPFLGVKAASKPDDIRRMGMSAEQVVTANQRAADSARQAMPNTPTELAIWANDPKRTPEEKQAAQAAMWQLEQHAIASRPVINNSIPGMQIGAGGANQTTGEEFLKSIPPSIAAQVKAIAEGRSGIPSASSRSQAAVQIRDAVFRYDPTFSEQRAQVRRTFTTGPEGKNIGALNTAIVHLGRLGDTAEALNNGSFTPGNELYNWARDKFGSEKVTNFGLLKDAVAGEMAAALKGNATDIEIEKMGKSIRASNSAAQMRGVIQEGMGILHDKANTYDERYHREMPDDTAWSPILPSAKEQLQRHGIKKAGGGQTSGGRKPLAEIFK